MIAEQKNIILPVERRYFLMSIYDFNSLGGGIVLGIRKPIIKAHGAANADSITNTSAMLLNIAKNNDVFYGKDNR